MHENETSGGSWEKNESKKKQTEQEGKSVKQTQER